MRLLSTVLYVLSPGQMSAALTSCLGWLLLQPGICVLSLSHIYDETYVSFESFLEYQVRVAHNDTTSDNNKAFTGIIECTKTRLYRNLGTYATLLNDKVKFLSRKSTDNFP